MNVEKLHLNDAYRVRKWFWKITHDLFHCFYGFSQPPQWIVNVRLFMVTLRGLNSYVFEVVIIMCGLNRFPLRYEKFLAHFLASNPFFLRKIIIKLKCACALLQKLWMLRKRMKRKIRYIDISGFPLEWTSKEDIKIQ